MWFTEILTIIFILLKVFGVISWSWWLVWLPEILAGVVYTGVIIFWLVTYFNIKKDMKKLNKKSDLLSEQRKEMMDRFRRGE